MTPDTNSEFEALLNYIKRSRGFDFTGYKRSTLSRRVQKRMQAVGIETISGYMDYLEVDPQEFIQLFNTILINVTSFFRDQSPWDYLQAEVIPSIVARKEPHEPIRVWSAGCASGQEAYTLAIALAEALGVEQFRERVKIYATDIDDEALNQGRGASYNAKEVENIPQELLERYFDCLNSQYIFRKDLRRAVIFGRHNLVQDAPISRIDLLLCRNTLMYFNAEAQAKIIARFHFALNQSAFLVLGKAEMLLSHNKSFTPLDLNRRIFTKVANVSVRDRLFMNNNDDESNYLSTHVRLCDTAFDVSTLAQMVVDVKGILVLVNDRMRSLFALSPRDVNRPLQDLEISYRPLELRSSISQANSERRTIVHKDVEWTNSNSDRQYFDVQVTPLFDNGNLLGSSISFNDVTRSKKLTEELEHSNQELEMAYEELQSTNEELETTNEELQSTNEELETTNEELQSTNEELETMNEELQSSNEELQTINDELRQRSLEINELNAFLEAILTSIRGAVVVVDQELQVLVWNNKSEDLWGWRSEEIQGQHFLNLDIGLPVEQLLQSLRSCLLGQAKYQEMTLQATNRRGKTIKCQVACTPLMGATTEIRGVIMLMEEIAEVENVNKV